MSDTSTVRINRETYNDLKDLAKKQQKSMQEIIDLAIKNYKKIEYFNELNLSYSRLKENPELWEEEIEERNIWDTALLDDLQR